MPALKNLAAETCPVVRTPRSRPARTDAHAIIEFSHDLDSGSWTAAGVTVLRTTGTDDGDIVTLRAPVGIAARPQGFLRLRFEFVR